MLRFSMLKQMFHYFFIIFIFLYSLNFIPDSTNYYIKFLIGCGSFTLGDFVFIFVSIVVDIVYGLFFGYPRHDDNNPPPSQDTPNKPVF